MLTDMAARRMGMQRGADADHEQNAITRRSTVGVWTRSRQHSKRPRSRARCALACSLRRRRAAARRELDGASARPRPRRQQEATRRAPAARNRTGSRCQWRGRLRPTIATMRVGVLGERVAALRATLRVSHGPRPERSRTPHLAWAPRGHRSWPLDIGLRRAVAARRLGGRSTGIAGRPRRPEFQGGGPRATSRIAR